MKLEGNVLGELPNVNRYIYRKAGVKGRTML